MNYRGKKIRFSVLDWNKSVPEPIAQLQMLVKTLMASATGITLFQTNADAAVWVGLGGLVVDYAFHCISIEEVRPLQ